MSDNPWSIAVAMGVLFVIPCLLAGCIVWSDRKRQVGGTVSGCFGISFICFSFIFGWLGFGIMYCMFRSKQRDNINQSNIQMMQQQQNHNVTTPRVYYLQQPYEQQPSQQQQTYHQQPVVQAYPVEATPASQTAYVIQT